jgi:hypothetical protein
VRYFDPDTHRAGLPNGVAALVEKLSADAATVTLVNIDPLASHSVVMQAGAYGEHSFETAKIADRDTAIDGPLVLVRLQPGCGTRIDLKTQRYANPPTLAQPWDDAN